MCEIDDSTTLTHWQPGLVSLPGDMASAPLLPDAAPPEAQYFLAGEGTRMLRPPSEHEALLRKTGVKGHMDPRLARCPAQSWAFVQAALKQFEIK